MRDPRVTNLARILVGYSIDLKEGETCLIEGPVEGEVVDVGAGRPEDVRRVAAQMKGRLALVVPEGADLDSVIYNFYRAPGLVRELKDAGARAVLIAADKPHAILYTAPVEFSATGRLAALPTASLAREDVELLRRLMRQGETPRVRLDVRNKIGGAFDAANVVGEIRGRELPGELVVVPNKCGVSRSAVVQPRDNQTLQRTGAAAKRSWFQKLFGRGPGR